MKILMLQDDFPPQGFGGAEASTFELAQGLQRAGEDVFVVTTCRKKSDEGKTTYQELKVFRIFADYHERYRAYLSLYNPQTVGKVRQLIKEFNPDIVHAHNIHNFLSWHCLKIAKELGKPVFFTARDVMSFSYGKLATKKYLEQLLRRFASEGIDVDFTTFYFGNNDATYNKEEDKVRLNRKKSTPESDGYRVSVEDYRRNLRDMVETTRDYDARPILIMPVVHYDWEPGIRSGYHKSEFGEALDELADKKVRKELERALREFKAGNYGNALELDMVLPRIKLRYQHILREIAREMNVPLIDIQAEIPRTDNSEYFADYCHPLEPTNQMITDKFFEVTGIEKGQRRTKDAFKLPLKYRIIEGVVDFLGCFVKHKSRKGGNEPPSRIYTTY